MLSVRSRRRRGNSGPADRDPALLFLLRLVSRLSRMDPVMRARILFFVLTLAGIILLGTPWTVLGWAAFGAALFVLIRQQARSGPPQANWIIVAGFFGFLLLMYGFSALDTMTHWLPYPLPFQAGQALPAAAGGCILLIAAFLWMRDQPAIALNPWVARLILGLIVYGGLYVRLHPLNEPNPIWSSDCALNLVEAKFSADFPSFRPLIYEYGSRQPFVPYLLVLAYLFFPDASSLLIQKVVWGMVDGAAIWVAYLLGKELGGRRTGLILAAALAFSKPTIVNCVSAQILVSTPLALGVMFLFTFRFLRKTDLKHSLYWGIAVAFGAYCYHASRPFIWWIPVAVTAWLLLWPRASRTRRFLLLGLGILAVWTFAFFRANTHPPNPLLTHPAVTVAAYLFAAFLLAWGLLQFTEKKPSRDRREAGLLTLGLLAAGILMAPMLLHPLFATHQHGTSAFNTQNLAYPQGGLTLSFWWEKFKALFAGFFLPFDDREDMGLAFESFWSLHSVPLIFSGLAWALVRRNRTAWFLLGCAAAGTLPTLLVFGTHTGRLMGVVPPLLLLGAVSVDALLRVTDTLGRWARMAGALALLFWGVWSYQGMHNRFLVALPRHPNDGGRFYQVLQKDIPQRRIYMLGSEFLPTPYAFIPLVDDRVDFLMFKQGGNGVPRFHDGRVPDVVLDFHASEKDLIQRLVRENPKGHLEMWKDPSNPEVPSNLMQFYLDGKDISRDPRQLFHVIDVPRGAWSRNYYYYIFGLGHGVMEHQEWVTDPLLPTPREPVELAQESRTVAIQGAIRVEKAGRYEFSVDGGNYAVLDIGDKRVLDYRPTATHIGKPRGRLTLKAGLYPVILRTAFMGNTNPPPVEVLFPGEKTTRPLGAFPGY